MENNLLNELYDELKKIVEDLSNDSGIDNTVAQKVGEYLYYHTQIELLLDSLISSLIPEIDIKILNLDSYAKKVSLIKSLVPNSSELGIFSLLEKLNKVRNVFAHQDPANIDFERINQPLINLLKDAFVHGPELSDKIDKIGKGGPITIPVKVIMITKMYLALIVKIEAMGKMGDKQLRTFESVRKFSSLFVRRRFSILLYQLQAGVKSGDAPSAFRQEALFAKYMSEIEDMVLGWFKR